MRTSRTRLWWWSRHGRGGSVLSRRAPTRSCPRPPPEVSFVFRTPMNPTTTTIATDLLTPARRVPPPARDGLGELPPGVGRARQARPELVDGRRLADRRVRGGRGARIARRRLRLRTTTSCGSSRRCRSRRTGPASRRAASSSPTRSSASTTARGRPRCSRATRRRSRAGSRPAFRGTGEAAGTPGPIRRPPDRARYEEMVRPVKEHIVAGDVFQCVPSQRAERPTSASPLDVYRALRRVNPSPYLFLLELDGIALVGSSPERLVACEDGRASLCPIAGTTEPDRRRRRAAPRPPRRTARST